MPTPTDMAARRQAHLETPETIAEQVGQYELAVARMANDPRWTSQKPTSCSAGPGTGSATCARCSARSDATSSRRPETERSPARIAKQGTVGRGSPAIT